MEEIMLKATAESLADMLRTVRADWDRYGIVAHLLPLSGELADIAAHAVRVAADRKNRTPAALAFAGNEIAPEREADSGRHSGNPAPCIVCGRGQWACQKARENAAAMGKPRRHNCTRDCTHGIIRWVHTKDNHAYTPGEAAPEETPAEVWTGGGGVASVGAVAADLLTERAERGA